MRWLFEECNLKRLCLLLKKIVSNEPSAVRNSARTKSFHYHRLVCTDACACVIYSGKQHLDYAYPGGDNSVFV